MAKSLRSKWKRKMKAIKRVRYGEKETAKLVKMVEQTKEDKKAQEEARDKETMEHEPQVLGGGSGEDSGKDAAAMDEDSEEAERKKKLLTIKNEHGTYPVWVRTNVLSLITFTVEVARVLPDPRNVVKEMVAKESRSYLFGVRQIGHINMTNLIHDS